MAWDIYGNTLARGHCEVHPWVNMEYPCPVCISEANQADRERKQRERQDREYQEYINKQLEADRILMEYLEGMEENYLPGLS